MQPLNQGDIQCLQSTSWGKENTVTSEGTACKCEISGKQRKTETVGEMFQEDLRQTPP